MPITLAASIAISIAGLAGPVIDSEGKLVGLLSEFDCIAVLAQAAADKWPAGHVSERMTTAIEIEIEIVPPTQDVFALSTRFSQGQHRRLLVVEDGKIYPPWQ